MTRTHRIDGLQYAKWSRRVFMEMRAAGLDAVHATISYHENFRETVANIEKWNGLSPVQQSQFEMACGDSVRHSIARGEAIQVPALEFLAEQGVQFHQWSQEFLDAYESAWKEVVTDEVDGDEDFARVWASLSEFRNSYSTWHDLGYLQ